jgi:hypothetical protein
VTIHPPSNHFEEVLAVSIVRIGLAETKKFAEGYESIFGSKKKKDTEEKPAQAKDDGGKKAKAGKKKTKK